MSKCVPDKINGETPFQFGETAQNFRLLDFWRWSASNLLDNTMRGMLAEYLVAVDVGTREKFRITFQMYAPNMFFAKYHFLIYSMVQ